MTLQRIGVSSAFRVGAIIYGLLFLVFGAFGLFCNLALLLPFSSSGFMLDGQVVSGSTFGSMSVLSLGIMCVIYVAGAAATALFGGLSLALMALFYNWAARWVGGVELEIRGAGGQMSAGTILSDMNGRRY